MSQSQRKLIGTVMLLAVLVVYAALVTAIYDRLLTGLPNWAVLIYFIIAGMGWVFPAGWVIIWMVRPRASDKP